MCRRQDAKRKCAKACKRHRHSFHAVVQQEPSGEECCGAGHAEDDAVGEIQERSFFIRLNDGMSMRCTPPAQLHSCRSRAHLGGAATRAK